MSDIKNPAPAPFPTVTVSTNSGPLVMPCEPINEWFAITPEFGMDEDGNAWLGGGFTIIHRLTGLNFAVRDGCMTCCRSAAKGLAALNVDWSALTSDDNMEWSAALPEETRRELATLREIEPARPVTPASPSAEEASDGFR